MPLKGKAGVETYAHTGKGFSVSGKEFKKALGRSSLADGPIVQAITDYEEALVRAEKNRVAQAFHDLVRDNPNPAVWEVQVPKDDLVADRYDDQGNLVTPEVGLGPQGKVVPLQPGKQISDEVVVAKFDGKPRYIIVKDVPLREGMRKMGLGRGVPFIQNVTNYMRAVAIQYNPEFLISNFTRDLQEALINITTDEVPRIRRNITRDTPKAIRGVWRAEREKGDSEWSAIFKEYSELGGQVSIIDQQTVEQRRETLRKQIAKYTSESKPLQALHAAADLVEHSNRAIEMGVRLATYKNLVDAGVPKAKAAQITKNLTINFNKKGDWGAAVNSLYLFANAGVQSVARMYHTLFNKSPKVRHRAWQIMGGIVGMSFLQSLANRLYDEDEWLNTSANDKDHYLTFPGGLAIRVPYGYNIFHVMGNLAEESVNGEATAGEAVSRMFVAMEDAFDPLGGGTFNQFIAPTALDPVVQWLENKTFFGGPIAKDQPTYGPKKPDSQLYFASVRGTTRAFTDWLFQGTGGVLPKETEDEKGDLRNLPAVQEWYTVDWNPETLDHFIDAIGGGTGKFVANVVNTGVSMARLEVPDIRNVPLARKFIVRGSEWVPRSLMRDLLAESGQQLFSPGQHERFYDALDRARQMGAVDKGEVERYAKLFRKNQDDVREALVQAGKNPTIEQILPAFARLSGQLEALGRLKRVDQAREVGRELREMEQEAGVTLPELLRKVGEEDRSAYHSMWAKAVRQAVDGWRSERERRGDVGPMVRGARASAPPRALQRATLRALPRAQSR